MLFGYFTLFVALVIEMVGAFYSVTGLAAIFSGAVIPILIMGGALEVGKVTAAVWLKNNWERASVAYKVYLVPAVVVLMFLTSMGIFGFLSKAHSDQNLVSGDVQSRVAIYDEKIRTARDNIDANRRALTQMDAQVDQLLGRTDDARGAERAVQIRRNQARERERLQTEIANNQKLIAQLNEQAAPIRAEIRKVEADVGPIKYIAKLIYGDNPDANLLEKAVVWVIIIIVAVFDPLALVLILAAQQSLRWAREAKAQSLIADEHTVPGPVVAEEPAAEPPPQEAVESAPPEPEEHPLTEEEREKKELEEVERFFWRGRMIAKALDAEEDERRVQEGNAALAEIEPEEPEVVLPEPEPESVDPEYQRLLDESAAVIEALRTEIAEKDQQLDSLGGHTSEVESLRNDLMNKNRRLTAQLTELLGDVERLKRENDQLKAPPPAPPADRLDLSTRLDDINLDLRATDSVKPTGNASFGTQFPEQPNKGDMFLRVDYLPSRLFKFNGTKWIESDKHLTDQFAYEDTYIKHLIEKLNTGEYDADDLNDIEREKIKEYLERNANPGIQ